MAKRAARSQGVPEGQERKVATPPQGATVVERAQGEFWNPNAGDALTGRIIGSRRIKNKKSEKVQRYLFAEEETGRVLILPDHWDLNERLKKCATLEAESEDGAAVADAKTLGTRLWIAFEGFEEADVQGGKLAFYNVAVLSEHEQTALPGVGARG